ncbi:uncharacterized protein [Argopecten irradians]|uniref:uncharacterized protein n=1 Tax=Argopecten irradians TaxID=31199 RepID=UPI00371A059E
MDAYRLVYIAVARTVSCHPTPSPDKGSHTRSSEAYVGRHTGGINMNVYILLLACVVIGSNATKVHNTAGYVSGGNMQYSSPTLVASPAVVQGIASPVYSGSSYNSGVIGIANPSYSVGSYSFPSGSFSSPLSGSLYNSAIGSDDIFNSAAIGSGPVLQGYQGYQTPINTQASLGSYINPVAYAGPSMSGLYNTGVSTYNVGIGRNTGVYNRRTGASYLLNAPTGAIGPHAKKAHPAY